MTYMGRNRLQVGAGRKEKKNTCCIFREELFLILFLSGSDLCLHLLWGGGGLQESPLFPGTQPQRQRSPPFEEWERKYELRFALFSDE